ncbi:MAG TPA: hypothetical protein VIE14_05380, partial [Steroidobacteraceae bacterium]
PRQQVPLAHRRRAAEGLRRKTQIDRMAPRIAEERTERELHQTPNREKPTQEKPGFVRPAPAAAGPAAHL